MATNGLALEDRKTTTVIVFMYTDDTSRRFTARVNMERKINGAT